MTGPGKNLAARGTKGSGMKLSYLVKGCPGHPLHPPLTDATIGLYTGATVFGVLSVLGVSDRHRLVA